MRSIIARWITPQSGVRMGLVVAAFGFPPEAARRAGELCEDAVLLPSGQEGR